MERPKPELEQWVDELFEASDQEIFRIFERIIALGHIAIESTERGELSQ